jgi:aminoglycoside/choline kinase family phosphotransferase
MIDVGGVTQIIVKAPGERASRYVQVGDYLSNGQVRVKRIENARSATPVVVLEELGQEVYKDVGEGVAQQPSQTKPAQEEKTALSLPESLTGGF